ncbi:hypothetical protein BGP77_05110 [Saccharospirillum sp. MSK14-1]|uniref:DUF934 domain-containing protein n=1 Tax=Saccharospirillum sp. MSK14-1 TaxID=1897632 RepID=UPI000D35643F|nr:DUF934 domain-containing protein [Saccharospirillum sp. MSK14-1]PTY36673.1 hypothetical protein BGP77_05110 [Saccharospirillum sp. MSK14-1]
MQNLIKNGALLTDDAWVLIEDDSTNIAENTAAILPLPRYLALNEANNLPTRVGVWLNDEQMADDVADLLDKVELVALHFPKFADGRSFSKARLLRDRLGYQGEIRAIGDFLPDQVDYMARCGIDAFACRNEQEARTALSMLDTFSIHYQGDVSQSALFQQR